MHRIALEVASPAPGVPRVVSVLHRYVTRYCHASRWSQLVTGR